MSSATSRTLAYVLLLEGKTVRRLTASPCPCSVFQNAMPAPSWTPSTSTSPLGRGHQKDGVDVPSLEMVKWFDSNYHYVKPTLQDNQTFKLVANPKAVVEFLEAKEAGIVTRPVLVGPCRSCTWPRRTAARRWTPSIFSTSSYPPTRSCSSSSRRPAPRRSRSTSPFSFSTCRPRTRPPSSPRTRGLPPWATRSPRSPSPPTLATSYTTWRSFPRTCTRCMSTSCETPSSCRPWSTLWGRRRSCRPA